MTVDLTKSTFTAEEAEELERMGYVMADVTALVDSERKWVIAISPQHNKENKEPSWQK